jgi:phosphoribosylaminoimidazolecarboxamide formyltransferase/IMP cyclohydrolase
MRALLSVNDKTGIVPFAQGLTDLGWEIISTGGTAAALRAAGLRVTDVAGVTGFAEMLDGRVKTLHPAIHGAILARRDVPDHLAQLAAAGITPIDLVACNLYDFAGTVAQPDVTEPAAVEQVDIGGVALLRAAAKNYDAVTVVSQPAEYAAVLAALRKQGAVAPALRRKLAAAAFAHTANYDAQIAMYLNTCDEELFPEELALPLARVQTMRYGENPHQRAAFYRWRAPGGISQATLADAETLHGKQLGYNNIMDIDAALNVVRDFAAPAAAIIKHAAPCGVAVAATPQAAFRRALAGDPVSAFGGIIGLNRPVDLATAQAIRESHFDAIIAPEYDADALALLAKRKNLILVATHRPILPLPVPENFAALDVRRISGGLLVQTPNQLTTDQIARDVVTQRAPAEAEWADLLFAWQCVKHVKSNAIVLAKDQATVGLCGGQPNRVDCIRISALRAGERSRGAALASDAYFPFADNIDAVVAAGATAIIQPGGSVRDAEVIAAADAHGLAMVFTRHRHFRH